MGTATELAAAVKKLTRSQQRFIDAYVRTKEVTPAAKYAKVSDDEGQRYLNDPVISQAIERRILLIEKETVRLTVKQDRLTIEQADAALFDVLTLPAKTHGHIKLRAIDLTYRRRGMIREDEFVIPNEATQNAGESKPAAPTMYRSFQRTITTQEHVQEMHMPVLPTSKPSPVIDTKATPAAAPVRKNALFELSD